MFMALFYPQTHRFPMRFMRSYAMIIRENSTTGLIFPGLSQVSELSIWPTSRIPKICRNCHRGPPCFVAAPQNCSAWRHWHRFKNGTQKRGKNLGEYFFGRKSSNNYRNISKWLLWKEIQNWNQRAKGTQTFVLNCTAFQLYSFTFCRFYANWYWWSWNKKYWKRSDGFFVPFFTLPSGNLT